MHTEPSNLRNPIFNLWQLTNAAKIFSISICKKRNHNSLENLIYYYSITTAEKATLVVTAN